MISGLHCGPNLAEGTIPLTRYYMVLSLYQECEMLPWEDTEEDGHIQPPADEWPPVEGPTHFEEVPDGYRWCS